MRLGRLHERPWTLCGFEYDFSPGRWDQRSAFAIPQYTLSEICSARFRWVSTRLCAV